MSPYTRRSQQRDSAKANGVSGARQVKIGRFRWCRGCRVPSRSLTIEFVAQLHPEFPQSVLADPLAVFQHGPPELS